MSSLSRSVLLKNCVGCLRAERLAPLVGSHQFACCQDVSGHGLKHFFFRGASRQVEHGVQRVKLKDCLLYTSPSPRDS